MGQRVEMRAIFLARRIAQYHQRFALIDAGAAGRRQAGVEGTDYEIFLHRTDRAAMRRANRMPDEAAAGGIDHRRGREQGIADHGDMTAFIGREQCRKQANVRPGGQDGASRYALRLTVRLQRHRIQQRQLSGGDWIGRGGRAEQRDCCGPVRRAAGTVGGQRDIHECGIDMADGHGSTQQVARGDKIARDRRPDQVPCRQPEQRIDIARFGGTPDAGDSVLGLSRSQQRIGPGEDVGGCDHQAI